jgi:hypothetical protein
LSEKKHSVKEVDIDFDRLARVGRKVNEVLVRKTKNSAEAYAAMRFLCVYYEESLGIVFQPEFEAELKRVVKQGLEENNDPTKQCNSQ